MRGGYFREHLLISLNSFWECAFVGFSGVTVLSLYFSVFLGAQKIKIGKVINWALEEFSRTFFFINKKWAGDYKGGNFIWA